MSRRRLCSSLPAGFCSELNSVVIPTPLDNVWYTTQYRSVNFFNDCNCSDVASDVRLNFNRIDTNPTGTSFDTPNVPRKSTSPSAFIVPSIFLMPIAVATARNVTPAHAANASSNMSPEQANDPVPPVAGCKPASTIALPVSTLHEIPSPNLACAFKVIIATFGSSRYLSFNGACKDLSSAASINIG